VDNSKKVVFMDLISLLIMVIVFGLLWYLVMLLPIPDPFKTIAQVIVVLICILALLGYIPINIGHIR